MLFFLYHFCAGLLTGAFFRVQMLVAFVLFVLVEMVYGAFVYGGSGGVLWGLSAEIVLQFGYVGGMCFRGILERFGLAAQLQSSRGA